MHKALAGIAVSALALAAVPAAAQGNGGGNGKGGGKPEQAQSGPGKAKSNPGNGGYAGGNRERQPGPSMRDTGPPDRAEGPSRDDRRAAPPQAKGRSDSPGEPGQAVDGGPDRNGFPAGPKDARGRDRDDRGAVPFRWSTAPRSVPGQGCPPGLAKKNNGCMPPGLARNDPWRSAWDRPEWWGFRNLADGRYRYVDGYLVRYDGDRIGSWLPLLGGALAIGQPWPSFYEPVALPGYYQDFYGLGPSYRYADNVLYRVDPDSLAIASVAALLTGDDLTIGQPLPDYYSVYNVPYSYRDRYVDGPDALYRYSDGYIYQVDPTTRLVQAAIELLI